MERLRRVLGRIPVTTSVVDGSRQSSAARTYECTYCGCTADSTADRCEECRIGRVVPAGPAFESKPGLSCRACGAVFDCRHDRCPECGGHRFDGAE